MKIYQVEELVGITKKNIRFYEDQGLLCPNRNPQNDYREYSLDDVKSMMLVSIDSIPGKDFEVLGIVKGTIVQSKNFGRDFMASMETLVGGEIKGYTEMLNEARQIATKRMVDEAEFLGADAVVGIKYGSSALMQGAAEIIAYGTAVRFK